MERSKGSPPTLAGRQLLCTTESTDSVISEVYWTTMNSNDNFKHTVIQIEGAYAQTGVSSHEQDEKSTKCHPVHDMYYICWLESLLLIRMAAINWT